MDDTAQPLTTRFPIIDPKTGIATEYFIKWAQQFAGNALPVDGITAGSGIAVTPGPTVSLNAGIDLLTDVDTSTTPPAVDQKLGWNGSLWVPQTATGGGNWWFQPPLASIFSLMNSDGTNLTLTDDIDAGLLINSNAPVSGAGQPTRSAYVTLTNPALAWDLKVRMPFFYPTTGTNGIGLLVHNSTSGRSIRLGAQSDRPLITLRFSALGTFSAIIAQPDTREPAVVPWWRIQFDGVNYVLSISVEGKLWLPIVTEPAATYLTAAGGSGNRVGFYIHMTRTTGMNCSINCEYWSLTGPGV